MGASGLTGVMRRDINGRHSLRVIQPGPGSDGPSGTRPRNGGGTGRFEEEGSAGRYEKKRRSIRKGRKEGRDRSKTGRREKEG